MQTFSYKQDLINKLNSTFSIIKNNLEFTSANFSKFTGKIPKNKLIDVGDVVYLNTPRIKVNTTKKLAKLNQVPFRVIAKTSPVVFKIKHINEPGNIQTVHLNRIFKVPERATFEWETSENETLVDIRPTAVQCLQTEEEILSEFPPYTLPIEPGEYQDDLTNEGRRNNIVQTVFDGEQETSREPVLESQGCEVDDREVILIPSISNEEQVPIGELVVEVLKLVLMMRRKTFRMFLFQGKLRILKGGIKIQRKPGVVV
ncbi:hypothetical protein AVEN_172751-1 [Araneus ventricosus]|uniref:Integrase p58-like C-terminal domain-containing protein n=1 Tax=Araneus ventricosus TaxID=182803 RepID=A0A4Y2BJB0_ARAVE|nr:hypothetical protein AVEN_172751-1 [Araneus ventricosus]